MNGDKKDAMPGVTRPRRTAPPPGHGTGMRKPTPEEQERCYGTMRACPRAHLCNLAEACCSRANEEASDIHYQHQNISVPFLNFNSGDAQGRSNGRRHGGAESPEERAAQTEAMFVADDDADDDGAEGTIDIGGVAIRESSYEDVRAVTEAICELAISAPASFNALVRKIYRGERQIDIARRDGKTRQAINKQLLLELGIAQKRNSYQEKRQKELSDAIAMREEAEEMLASRDSCLSSLSLTEFLVFKLSHRNRLSNRKISEIVGVSERTVYNLRRKMAKKAAGGGKAE